MHPRRRGGRGRQGREGGHRRRDAQRVGARGAGRGARRRDRRARARRRAPARHRRGDRARDHGARRRLGRRRSGPARSRTRSSESTARRSRRRSTATGLVTAQTPQAFVANVLRDAFSTLQQCYQVDGLRLARRGERRPGARRRGRSAAAQGDDPGRPRARRFLAVIVDYHMHLRAPDESIEHTVEAVERFVERAAERGIDEIGFTEHVYYFEQTRPLWSMPYHLERCVYDIEPYVDAVVEAKRRGHPVKLGIEVDYEPGREEETAEALAPYPWDYVLGSIHFLDGLGIDAEPSLVDSRRRRRRVAPLLRGARACGAQRALRLARASRPREVVRRRDRLGLGGGRGLARRRRDRGLERGPAQAAREALPEPGLPRRSA